MAVCFSSFEKYYIVLTLSLYYGCNFFVSTCVWICQSSHNRNCKKSSERSKERGVMRQHRSSALVFTKSSSDCSRKLSKIWENKPSTTKALLRNYPLCRKNSTSGAQRSLTRRPNTWMFSPCYTGNSCQLPGNESIQCRTARAVMYATPRHWHFSQ